MCVGVSIIFYQSADCPYLIAAIAVHWCFSQIIKQHPRFHELLDQHQPTHCSLSSSVTGACTVMTLPSWWHQTRGRINNVRNGWFPVQFSNKTDRYSRIRFFEKKNTSWLSEWLEWKTSENNREQNRHATQTCLDTPWCWMKNTSGIKMIRDRKRKMSRQTFKRCIVFSLILDKYLYFTSEKKKKICFKKLTARERSMATVSWKLREKKTKDKHTSCRLLLYLCKMWSLAQWRPRWNVVCWWLEGITLKT